jgi:uncharacterized protein (DUF58 family)
VRLPPPRARANGAGARIPVRGGSDDLLGLRPYRPGDDTRQVHWRKSAAIGSIVLREHTAEGSPEIELELDDVTDLLARPDNDDERRKWVEQFEIRLRDVASRAVAHLGRGDTILLHTTSGTRIHGNPRLGSDPVLRFLALLEPSAPVAIATKEAAE